LKNVYKIDKKKKKDKVRKTKDEVELDEEIKSTDFLTPNKNDGPESSSNEKNEKILIILIIITITITTIRPRVLTKVILSNSSMNSLQLPILNMTMMKLSQNQILLQIAKEVFKMQSSKHGIKEEKPL